MKKNILVLVVATAMVLFACSPADSASAPKVDWSIPAKSLDDLENQVIAWQIEYNKVTNNETWTADNLAKSFSLNLERGLVVAKGFLKLKESWDNDFSESTKLQKFPALTVLSSDGNIPGMVWLDPFGAPIGYELTKPIPASTWIPEPITWVPARTLRLSKIPKRVEAVLTKADDTNIPSYKEFIANELSPKEKGQLEDVLLDTWADFVARNSTGIDKAYLKKIVRFRSLFSDGVLALTSEEVSRMILARKDWTQDKAELEKGLDMYTDLLVSFPKGITQ